MCQYVTIILIILHYITLHYITLHYFTLHYIALHYITLHYITLRYVTLHYITLHYIILHYTTLHCITLHYITLHYITLPYISITLYYLYYVCHVMLYVMLCYVTLHYTTLHCNNAIIFVTLLNLVNPNCTCKSIREKSFLICRYQQNINCFKTHRCFKLNLIILRQRQRANPLLIAHDAWSTSNKACQTNCNNVQLSRYGLNS